MTELLTQRAARDYGEYNYKPYSAAKVEH